MSTEYQQVPAGSVPTVALLLTCPSSCRQLREFLKAYVARVKRVKAKVGGREDMREEGGEHRSHEVQREVRSAYGLGFQECSI